MIHYYKKPGGGSEIEVYAAAAMAGLLAQGYNAEGPLVIYDSFNLAEKMMDEFERRRKKEFALVRTDSDSNEARSVYERTGD